MNKPSLANFYNDGIFHVYNRTNNKELLFFNDDNRLYFLKQYAKYLSPFVETFCWTLLPNHFHFLVKVKSVQEIKLYLNKLPTNEIKQPEKNYLADNASAELLLEFEWKRFFTSYAMALNKQRSRSGNLFHRPFKRVEVNKETHFTQTIIYIHANAVKHKLCKNFTEYRWSSWQSLISEKPTHLNRNEILEWFGGLQAFISSHKAMSEYYYNTELAIEAYPLLKR